MFTPSIPPGDISWTYKANTSIGEQTNAAPFGERRRGRLPLPRRAQPVGGPVTGTYTKAAAINELGPGTGGHAFSSAETLCPRGDLNPHALLGH
jgi:hypothetical protein